jgi:hypothetical protein
MYLLLHILLNEEFYSRLGLRISDVLVKLIAAQLAKEFCVFLESEYS